MKILLIVLAALTLLTIGFVLGSTRQQIAPVTAIQAEPAIQATNPDTIHKIEMENLYKTMTNCMLLIEDYQRRSEHSPNERRNRSACVEVLQDTGLTRKEMDAIIDKRRGLKP